MQDVVGAIRQDFLASGCTAPVLFDKVFLPENASPPRVVIVPTTDRYTSPQAINGLIAQQVGLNPRPYWTRFASCDVHLWAAGEAANGRDQLLANYEALDRLLNQFVMSVTRATNAVMFDGGSWLDKTSHVKLGLVYVLKATIEFPVIDVAYQSYTGLTYKTVNGVGADITTELKQDQTVLGSVSFSTRP